MPNFPDFCSFYCEQLPNTYDNEMVIGREILLQKTFMRSVERPPFSIKPYFNKTLAINGDNQDDLPDDSNQKSISLAEIKQEFKIIKNPSFESEQRLQFEILHKKTNIISEIYLTLKNILEKKNSSDEMNRKKNILEGISKNLELFSPFYSDYYFLYQETEGLKNKNDLEDKNFCNAISYYNENHDRLTDTQKSGLFFIRNLPEILYLKIFVKKMKEDMENESGEIKNHPIHRKMVPIIQFLNKIFN